MYLDGDKTHEGHAAGWEVATPYVDEHKDKGTCEDAKVEEREEAGDLCTSSKTECHNHSVTHRNRDAL